MSPAELLAVDGLSKRERRVIEIAARERATHADIADRLGISTSQVNQCLVRARQRAQGKRAPARTSRTLKPVMDADWFPRQVAYVRSLANSPDPTHQQRYLNGIALVWGQEWADRVEQEAANGG
jgi:DNA-binding CsgD family transcriptional regulator